MVRTSIWRQSQSQSKLKHHCCRWSRCNDEITFLQKIKFSQKDDSSATSDLAHVPATYGTNMCTKFRCGFDTRRCNVAASYNDADDASPWWRRLYDVTALLRFKRCGWKILEKVQFSERYNTSATFHLAHVQATYDTGLPAKFRRRTVRLLQSYWRW